jgi:hypothetical protein
MRRRHAAQSLSCCRSLFVHTHVSRHTPTPRQHVRSAAHGRPPAWLRRLPLLLAAAARGPGCSGPWPRHCCTCCGSSSQPISCCRRSVSVRNSMATCRGQGTGQGCVLWHAPPQTHHMHAAAQAPPTHQRLDRGCLLVLLARRVLGGRRAAAVARPAQHRLLAWRQLALLQQQVVAGRLAPAAPAAAAAVYWHARAHTHVPVHEHAPHTHTCACVLALAATLPPYSAVAPACAPYRWLRRYA